LSLSLFPFIKTDIRIDFFFGTDCPKPFKELVPKTFCPLLKFF
jgi:hypothetical protein